MHLSARISGTCGAAEIAAGTAAVPVIVVDSRHAGDGRRVRRAVRGGGRAGRRSAEAVAALVRRRAAASTTYFYVDSLEYLRRGGRIGTAAAVLGSALSVKPLLTVADGEIRAYERVRTESKALARLEELGLAALARAAGRSDHVDVAVHHLDNARGGAAARRPAGRTAARQPRSSSPRSARCSGSTSARARWASWSPRGWIEPVSPDLSTAGGAD